jgi:DNA primase catalytic subunit
MISLSKLLKHYKRPEIQEEIFYNAKNREIAVKFEKGFGKRPDTLQYPSDVLEFVKKKATSFHISEEIWFNPSQISTKLSPKDLNKLRKGWDLVLDIDGIFDFSKIVAIHTIEFLQSYNIKSISCKFSGNKGFHIAIPFESFPEEVNGKKIRELFPEAPRRIAAYIWNRIENKVSDEILKKFGIEEIIKITCLSFNEITFKDNNSTKLKLKGIVDIDTVLISSRHLYRSVYSFNEKSGLISIPIKLDRIRTFSKIEAKPENVRISKYRFLDRQKCHQGECAKLFKDAYDWTFDEKAYMKKEFKEKKKNEFTSNNVDEIQEAIPEKFFPPCINLILQGLKDGKKRSLFILVNFLTSIGWTYETIEEKLNEWNKLNENPLKEGTIKNHIRYHKQRKEIILPPNCNNEGYYISIGVCKPDNLCQKIKNPVQYSKVKARNN